MTLEDLLSEKRSIILPRWFDVLLEVYPADTRSFLKNQKNRFTNPVGRRIHEGLEALFEQLIQRNKPSDISAFLDNIMRIRAVQDLSPSQAIAFIPHLKRLIRQELREDIHGGRLFNELSAFESRIDDIALLAFDTYMKCRERIYEIKANELRRRTVRLMRKMGFFDDSATLDWESDESQIKKSP